MLFLIEIQHEEKMQRAILVSVDTGEYDIESAFSELKELAKTAGAETIYELCQKREAPSTATYIGAGRAEELKELCEIEEADLVIVDTELTATQQRNLENIVEVPVIDRTTLILDIFASRARSAEGRIQVELAQLQYRLPRLAGQGLSLSRLGGGIGTRGPGETKLETDKRHIRRRILALKNQLQEVEKRREGLRERRKKNGVPTVALVGYTNAGKSTLLNYLTNAGVLAEDMLFATLDPVSRALQLPDGRKVLLIDTVGFVRRLPHHLVQAFRSTLEETIDADVILNVCDASSKEALEHWDVTRELLMELGCADTPMLAVMNKCDIAMLPYPTPHAKTICISARTGRGIPELLELIAQALPPNRKTVDILFPYSMGGLAEKCRKEGNVELEEYETEGLRMRVTLGPPLLDMVEPYIQSISFDETKK